MNETTAVAASVPQYLEPARQHYQRITSERKFVEEVNHALQIFSANSYLAGATQESKLQAVMNVATSGLTLNPVQRQAYLVPRKRNGKLECHLEPSYMGLVKLLTDSGSVKMIECHWIYEGDEVDIDMASERKILRHVPYAVRSLPKGRYIACYSIATLADGSKHIELMSNDEIQSVMRRSEAYKAKAAGNAKTAGPWESDYDEMGRKTVIKRHWKHLPKSGQIEQVAQAIALDNEDYKLEETRPATLSPEQSDMLELQRQARTLLKTYAGSDRAEIIESCKAEAESGMIDVDFWRNIVNKLQQ